MNGGGGSSDDQAIAFRATDQRCLMAMALVQRPGRCLERLAGDQLQGVKRGGERLWCQKMEDKLEAGRVILLRSENLVAQVLELSR